MNANVIAKIYMNLPGRDCGEKSPCKRPLCKLFAEDLLKGLGEVSDCPYLEDEHRQSIVMIIDETFV